LAGEGLEEGLAGAGFLEEAVLEVDFFEEEAVFLRTGVFLAAAFLTTTAGPG